LRQISAAHAYKDRKTGGDVNFIRRIWTAAPLATTILAVAVVVLGFFAFRLVDDVFRPDPPRDVAIEDWMTPRMISHSWKVPRREMVEILGLDNEEQGRRTNIRQLAEALETTPEDLILQIETGIATYRAEKDQRGDKDSDDD